MRRMNMLNIIKEEHRQVAAMFDKVEKMDPDDARLREIARTIERELSAHLATEERLFYAELRKRAENSEELVEVFEAFTEHEAAKSLMEMLRSGRKADEKFKAELKVLGENVRHHVQEEESKIFSLAHEMMDDEELEERGEEWEKTKKRVMARAGNGARKSSPARKKTSRTRRYS
jgi:iron-sulfur cluster repair protein YtfE (RIC family)